MKNAGYLLQITFEQEQVYNKETGYYDYIGEQFKDIEFANALQACTDFAKVVAEHETKVNNNQYSNLFGVSVVEVFETENGRKTLAEESIKSFYPN